LKRINFLLLTVISLILLVSVNAQLVSHPAEEIIGGTFGAGLFSFPNNLAVIGDLTIDNNAFTKLKIVSGDGVDTKGFSAIDFYDNTILDPTDPIWGLGKNNFNKFYISEFGKGNRLVISPGGNVGIGIDSPGFPLDVVGDVRWTGTLQSPAKVPWDLLTSVPAGLNDGDQVGITTEDDPQVGVLTSGKWCREGGGAVQCDQDAPGSVPVSEGLYGRCVEQIKCFAVSSGCQSGPIGLMAPAFCGPPFDMDDCTPTGVCTCPAGYELVRTAPPVTILSTVTEYYSCYKT